MNRHRPAPETPVLATLRTILLWALILGAAGTVAELLLIGHDESAAQWVPLALLSAGVVIGLWLTVAPSWLSLSLWRGLMVLFLASGLVGIVLHYRGNEEFERERQPSAAGWPLMAKTLTGATPVLAPGAMSLLGVVGLAFAYRHPLLRSIEEMSSS